MNKRVLVAYFILLLALLTVALPAAATSPAGASTLGNYVWLDANGDGEHLGQTGEAEFTGGINGVKVNLYEDLNKNGVVDPGEYLGSKTTGDDPNSGGTQTGYYLFTSITANGNQYIVEIDPSNYAVGGPLEGYILTSKDTYGFGLDLMVVSLPQILVDYKAADFGFMKQPITVDKMLLNSSLYALSGDTVTFRIRVTNASALTVNPVPLDDFYSPACLKFVSASIAPDSNDPSLGLLHWNNIGPLGPGGFKDIDVTFTAQMTTEMAWKEGGWQDYAPKGMPDFDARQANWDNPIKSASGWYQDGPVAVANSLWWFDSKFEPGSSGGAPLPPPNISDGYNLIQSYNTFTPTVTWDDHDPRNVPPFVNALSSLMATAAGTGTTPANLANGLAVYITNQGLAPQYTVATAVKPSFQAVGNEVRGSKDVVLLLGFWQEAINGSTPVRVGGHYVTPAGIDMLNGKIGLSDPMRDHAEAGGIGRVLPGVHADSHPDPIGISGNVLHNDAQYISQDVYANAPLSPAIRAGNWGLQGYVNANPATGCPQVAAYQGKNVPAEFAGQQGSCSTTGGALWTVIEYAIVVSPASNSLLCAPTTNIAAVTDARIQNGQLTLPPAQDEASVTQGMDLGDFPDKPYPTLIASNGARHLITSPLMLGAKIDSELDGQPNTSATGDDWNGTVPDDEDGVQLTAGFQWQDGTVASGKGGSLTISINGGRGVPQVFLNFGTGLNALTLRDALANPLPVTAWAPGTYIVYFDVPAGTMALGPILPTRVRLSSAGGLAATGLALDGEVEDYIFQFVPTAVTVESMSGTQVGNLGLTLGLLALLALTLAGWRVFSLRANR